MHILIIPSEEYVPTDKPTAAIFQHDQAKLIKTLGYQVGAISFKFPHTLLLLLKALIGQKTKKTEQLSFFQVLQLIAQLVFSPLQSSLSFETKDGVYITRCSGGFRLLKSDRGKNYYKVLKLYGDYAFRVYCKKHGKPDIIHAHNMFFAGFLGQYLSNKYSVPMLLTEHSSEHFMTKTSIFKYNKAKILFNSIPNINAVSPALINQLTKLYAIPENKIEWFQNVIPARFEQENLTLNPPKDEFIFLNVANLIPLKGQAELIKAFYLIQHKIPTAKLKIVGGGELEDELKLLVKNLNLQEKVSILGYLDRANVLEQMKKCDAFVFPSHYETFGVVLIEVLALGKPVIASKCGGPECIVNEKNGLLVAPKDVESLSEGLLKMYLERNKYNSLNIKNDVINRFGSEQFLKRIHLTYKRIIHDYHH